MLVRFLAQRVHAHRLTRSGIRHEGTEPYWRDVGTLDAYWEANIDLTRVTPALNLYDPGWPVFTERRHLPPAKFVFDDATRRGTVIGEDPEEDARRFHRTPEGITLVTADMIAKIR